MESEVATRTAEANRRRRQVEAVAHRWGLIIVPSVLGLFDGDHAARLYHTTYARHSVVEHGLRGRAYLAAHQILHHPRSGVGKRRAQLLEDHAVLSVNPLGWLLTGSSRDVIVVEPVAAALEGAFWISPDDAFGGSDFGDDAISRDAHTLARWIREADGSRTPEIWVPWVPPEFIREVYLRTESHIPGFERWVSKAGLAVRVGSLTELRDATT
jgi:hypothetical protein